MFLNLWETYMIFILCVHLFLLDITHNAIIATRFTFQFFMIPLRDIIRFDPS